MWDVADLCNIWDTRCNTSFEGCAAPPPLTRARTHTHTPTHMNHEHALTRTHIHTHTCIHTHVRRCTVPLSGPPLTATPQHTKPPPRNPASCPTQQLLLGFHTQQQQQHQGTEVEVVVVLLLRGLSSRHAPQQIRPKRRRLVRVYVCSCFLVCVCVCVCVCDLLFELKLELKGLLPCLPLIRGLQMCPLKVLHDHTKKQGTDGWLSANVESCVAYD